jgi:biotin carboxyl carrier protein
VAEIARLLEESDFEELHVEQDGLKLTLRRGTAPAREAPVAAAAAGAAVVPADAGGAPRGASPRRPPAARSFRSPRRWSASSTARPARRCALCGGRLAVQPDSIIGIIEVMKLRTPCAPTFPAR